MAHGGEAGTIDTGNAIIQVVDGALNVHTADVHHFAAIRKFHKDSGVSTTLSVAATSEDTDITVVSATGFVVGDNILLGSDSVAGIQSLYIINAIVANTFTLDRPVDITKAIGTNVHVAITAMQGIAGTITSPVIYHVAPTPDEQWHITRFIVTMTHGSAGDLGLFGNLASLLNGVTLRLKSNGQYYNLTNWKANSDIKADFYDVEFDTRSGGGGTFGTSGRGSFYKLGMVIDLNGADGDSLEVLVQDNLTALSSFVITAQGHVV